MPLGIRPTVDFAFKMLFGNASHPEILIDLISAVIQPECPIDHVEILNPIDPKNFDDDKLSIVDVKARDAAGNFYVIEVQTTLPAGLRNRLVYYTSGLYYRQLLEGQGYTSLRPAISICFLTQPLFPDISSGQLKFSLYDMQHQLQFGDQLEIHLVELSKYNMGTDELNEASPLERWAFFMNRAADLEADELRRLLNSQQHHQATGVLEMITRNPELRLAYDDRAKEAQDKVALRIDSLVEGRAEGLAEGKARGTLIGQIKLLNQFLATTSPSDQELDQMELNELESLADALKTRLLDRQ